jgi:Tfp pilus assembly protein PilO
MQLITPILMLIISISLFFGFIDPQYKKVAEANRIEKQYNEALNRSKELQQIRESLLSEYNSFKRTDIDRVEKLLPDNIDNVRLVIEIDNMAKKHGLTVRNLNLREEIEPVTKIRTLAVENRDYSSVTLEFSVAASYENLKRLIADLESSLRLVDITSISFRTTGGDFDEYRIMIRTYWLR